jgi:release factor glutamine methyltransferase
MVYRLGLGSYVKYRTRREHLTRLFGLHLEIPPTVFDPSYYFSSRVFGKYIQGLKLHGKSVLDMGCGSGILSLVAARNGAMVIAVDKNPRAADASRCNAERNNLEQRVCAFQSDLFANLPRERRFDIILMNPPYLRGAPRDMIELGFKGGDYGEFFRTFSAEAGNFLTPEGKILLILSSDADEVEILGEFRRKGYVVCLQCIERSLFEKFSIYEITV